MIIRQPLLLPEELQDQVADVPAQAGRILVLEPVLAQEGRVYAATCISQLSLRKNAETC